MSEEAISGSDLEPDLNSEEDLEEEEEEMEEEDDDENDGDDEDEAPDHPQGTSFSTENEAQGGDTLGWQRTPPSTSPSGEPSSQPSSRPPSRPSSQPDSHSSVSVSGTKKRISKPAHMRRNIRKLLREHQLEAVTKAAQQEELERRKRLEQQRKEFPVPPLTDLGQGDSVLRVGEVSQSASLAQVAKQEVICLDSSASASEDDARGPAVQCAKDDVIELSSGEDDVPQMSDAANGEDDRATTPGTEESSGAHINDALNQPDAEGRVLVNINHPANECDLYLAPQLARAVKPHQIGGIRFLYDNLVESLERYKNSSGFGCILAHSMGLGKTLQVISFIDILLRHAGAHTVLAIVPVNTLQNWLAEFNLWLPAPEALPPDTSPDHITARTFKVHILNDEHKTTAARAKVISDWSTEGGVLLMGYEMYRLLSLKKSFVTGRKKKSKKPVGPVIIDLDEEDRQQELLKGVEKALSRPGPDVVICDEGHRIKNCHASTSQALKSIRSRRRVVLTGYPLQNNLMEYWCMVDFVRPDFLGTRQEFSNMFERPILNGQCVDSTPQDVRLMRYRSHVLHSLLEGFVQRRGHDVLRSQLPSKQEYVVLVRLSPIQRALYTEFMNRFREAGNSGWLSLNPLKAFCVCCKIWNHPDVLYEALQKENLASEQDLDLDDISSSGSNRCQAPGLKAKPPDPANSKFSLPGLGILQEKANQVITYEWAKDIMSNYRTGVLENSAKMVLLFHLIDKSVSLGDKVLVFSQSLSTLSVIEEFLVKRPIPLSSANAEGQNQNWVRNVNYYRLDGSTSASERERLINQFNDPGNDTAWLFLLSTRAGCLGVNLIGASRVVVFDASWNPCHDAQAVCRVYRYGQRKPCHIYRLVCDFTLEKKIYDRQISKQGMSDRVVDDLNPVLNFTRREVESLLHFVDEEPDTNRVHVKVSDETETVIQQACDLYPHLITKQPFHHDSLLMDRKEMKLTKAEKKAAKKSYEDEKRASVPYTRPSYAHYYPASDQSLTNIPAFSQRNWRPPRPDEKPVASVRPVQSTPIPMMPRQVPMGPGSSSAGPSSGVNFPVNYLQKAGVFVQKIVTTTDIVIPGSNSSSDVQARISAGESIHVIRGTKGTYIRTSDGRIFAIRAAGKSRPGDESTTGQQDTQRSSEGVSSNGSNGCVSPDRKRLTPDSIARPLSPDSPEILGELQRYAVTTTGDAAGSKSAESAASAQARMQEGSSGSAQAQSDSVASQAVSNAAALDLRGAKRKSSTPSSEERTHKQASGKHSSVPLSLQNFPLAGTYGLPPMGLNPALLGSVGHAMFMGAGSPYFQSHSQLGDPRLMFPMATDPFGLGGSNLPCSSSSVSSTSSTSSMASTAATGSSSGSLHHFMMNPSMAGMMPPGFPLAYGQSLMPETRMYANPLLPGSGLSAPSGTAGSGFLSHFPTSSLLGAALRQSDVHTVSENGGSSSDDDVIEVMEQ